MKGGDTTELARAVRVMLGGEGLDDACPLADVPALDSLRLLEVVALAEERFGLRIEAAGLDGLATVGDVVALLLRAARPS